MLIREFRKVFGALVGILLSLSGGCDPVTRPPADSLLPGVREMISADQTFHHAVGDVRAGQPIHHVFRYRNESDAELRLVSDRDIETSCGCTRVDLRKKHLSPGESTELSLEIDTSERVGDVSESATVTWQRPDGQLRHCQFRLTARVTSVFAIDPPELNFSKRDLRNSETKTFRCMSDLNLDWQHVGIHVDVPWIDIRSRDFDVATGELRVVIRCRPTHEGDTRRAVIRLSGNELVDGPTRPEDAPPQYSATLPVYSADLAELRISPSLPVLTPSENARIWRGYLILTGDQIESGGMVTKVAATRCQVDFESTRLGNRAQRIDVAVSGPLRSLRPNERRLEIRLNNGARHGTQVRLASSSQDTTSQDTTSQDTTSQDTTSQDTTSQDTTKRLSQLP